MTIQDDETLRLYVEESLEHLGNLENDILAIEEGGADIDEELVNKVFRAAHSIKGGAGFMGLNNIKELSHRMENILGMIRSRELIPNPKITNVLLSGLDLLREMMADVGNSEEWDISEQLEALEKITADEEDREGAESTVQDESSAAEVPVEEAGTAPGVLEVTAPSSQAVLHVAEEAIRESREQGKYLYLVEYDLGKNEIEVPRLLEELEHSGSILARTESPAQAGGDGEGGKSDNPRLALLFATILDPEMIGALFPEGEQELVHVTEDLFNRVGPSDLHTDPEEKTAPGESLAQQQNVEPVIQAEPMVQGAATAASGPELDKEPDHPDSAPPQAADKPPRKSTRALSGGENLRVHVSLLDSLMNLAGELVLGRNQLLQAISLKDERTIETAAQRLDLITSELQETIMLTRMQPVGNIFNKFTRVVRDLASMLGKNVQLSIEGKEVELDKTIIEAISDPLTHLIRNSVDHGIEPPDVRKRMGKNPTGSIFLRAYHEAGQVNIEIFDDGKGMDGRQIAETAVRKGLVSDEQVKGMSDKEKLNLIFLPGFSTAEAVTDVSGRGVGMDVVKTNLDKLGGIVDIDSKPGEGTRIQIKLPLTLAIIPSQIVTAGGDRYAIPQINMSELLRIPAAQIKERIERVGDAEVVRLRGQLLPLLKLTDVLGVESMYRDPETGEVKPDRRKAISDRRSKSTPLHPEEEAQQSRTDSREETQRNPEDRRYHAGSAVNIVVCSTGALKYGLVVDELNDSEEIVVKPLGRHLKRCRGYAGATIMGDGRVALILDVANLAHIAGLTSLEGAERASDLQRAREAVSEKGDTHSLLLFRSAAEDQYAVPLNLVERIERIKVSQIEDVGGRRVIQYRGKSLPLFSIDEAADVRPIADSEELIVIVFNIGGREIGLLATRPIDAMEVTTEIDANTFHQPGIMGSAIIGGHTTLLVDIFGLVETLHPDWFEERQIAKASDGENAQILIAEDSSFFRNQVKGFLEKDGYRVLDAEDGMIAWDMLEKHQDEVSLVVTDIEMPNLDGFALTKKIRADSRFAHLPVIALTTLASEEDVARGKEAGVDDYQIKLDKEKLLLAIHERLSAAP
ncbi:MAG: hybrid sensor histidine kinase/response regulator [Deltaproteobacteria bacterium]|nr:MAG: hybrid sensor histidine kinase/response regulator [Deltaproteobacteria bacterium]